MRAAPRIAKTALQHRRRDNGRLRPKHRDWVKTLPCCVCGAPAPSDPHHVRLGTDGGTGLKPSDRFVVPLCRPGSKGGCHDREHAQPATFWATLNVDPVDLSNRLWAVTGDDEQGMRALERFWQRIALNNTENQH